MTPVKAKVWALPWRLAEEWVQQGTSVEVHTQVRHVEREIDRRTGAYYVFIPKIKTQIRRPR